MLINRNKYKYSRTNELRHDVPDVTINHVNQHKQQRMAVTASPTRTPTCRQHTSTETRRGIVEKVVGESKNCQHHHLLKARPQWIDASSVLPGNDTRSRFRGFGGALCGRPAGARASVIPGNEHDVGPISSSRLRRRRSCQHWSWHSGRSRRSLTEGPLTKASLVRNQHSQVAVSGSLHAPAGVRCWGHQKYQPSRSRTVMLVSSEANSVGASRRSH
jgi:hypothetical protein